MNLSNEYDIYDIYKKDSLDLIDYYINKYPTSFESNEIVNLFQKKIYNKKISLGKKRGRQRISDKLCYPLSFAPITAKSSSTMPFSMWR